MQSDTEIESDWRNEKKSRDQQDEKSHDLSRHSQSNYTTSFLLTNSLPTLVPASTLNNTNHSLSSGTLLHQVNERALNTSITTNFLNSVLSSYLPSHRETINLQQKEAPILGTDSETLQSNSNSHSNSNNNSHNDSNNTVARTKKDHVGGALAGVALAGGALNKGEEMTLGDEVLVTFDKTNAANMTIKSRTGANKRAMRHRTRLIII